MKAAAREATTKLIKTRIKDIDAEKDELEAALADLTPKAPTDKSAPKRRRRKPGPKAKA